MGVTGLTRAGARSLTAQVDAGGLGAAGEGAAQAFWLTAVVIASATVLKVSLFPLLNADLTEYFLKWVAHVGRSGLASLGETVTDYPPGYSYVLLVAAPLARVIGDVEAIKACAVAGDLLLAASGGLMVWRASGGDAVRAAFAVAALFALPTVVVNSGAWGQSDALWSAVAMLCVHAMAKPTHAPAAAALALGAAMAIKPQAVFLAPVLLGYLRATRTPLRWSLPLLAAPLVLMALPMLLAGRDWFAVIRPYAYHTLRPSLISQGAASAWALAPAGKSQVAFVVGCVVAAAAGLCLAKVAERAARTRSPLAIVTVAALACTAMPFVLPKMHDRYFYMGEVLAVAAACLNPRLLPAVVLGQASSLMAYQDFLVNLSDWRQPIGALMNLGAILLLAREMRRLLGCLPRAQCADRRRRRRWRGGARAEGGTL